MQQVQVSASQKISMEPLVISQADYEAGNYPKDTPIMVGLNVGMNGNSDMNAGKAPTKIKVTLIPA